MKISAFLVALYVLFIASVVQYIITRDNVHMVIGAIAVVAIRNEQIHEKL